MAASGTTVLARLLASSIEAEREEAWAAFVEAMSPLLLHTVRASIRGRDPRMDAYAFVLEHLRRDDCERLRRFTDDGRADFTTWLVVVARRLCVDFLRGRYGRHPSGAGSVDEPRRTPRRVAVVVAGQLGIAMEAPDPSPGAESGLLAQELSAKLSTALQGLSEAERLVLALRFEDDRTGREIARILNLPSPFHAYRRIDSALAAVRTSLRQMGVDIPGR